MRHADYDMDDTPLDPACLAAIPTDYGPPPSGPLYEYLAMPAEERPPPGEVLRRIAARRPEEPAPEPDTPVIQEWMKIPATSPANPITGGCALNIRDPFGRPGGDWHDCWHYARRAHQAPMTATLLEDAEMTPAYAFVERHVLGTRRVANVRGSLRAMHHPDAAAPAPIWSATHERATVGYVLGTILQHHAPAPDDPEKILDRRTVRRWLGDDDQAAWTRTVLGLVGTRLPPARQAAIEAWLWNAFDNPAPTE